MLSFEGALSPGPTGTEHRKRSSCAFRSSPCCGLKGRLQAPRVVGFGTPFGQCPRSASYHPGVAVTMSLLT